MTDEEYTERLVKLKKMYNEAVQKATQSYVISKFNISVGDIIEDSHQTIKVETTNCWASIIFGGMPHVFYGGPLLTKGLTLFKSGKHGKVYLCNLRKNHTTGKVYKK